MSSTTIRRPETERQAADFTKRNRRYLTEGLCYRCAAQAAYGHAHGFSFVHVPCGDCRPIVDGFPIANTNGWRSLGRDAIRARKLRPRG